MLLNLLNGTKEVNEINVGILTVRGKSTEEHLEKYMKELDKVNNEILPENDESRKL